MRKLWTMVVTALLAAGATGVSPLCGQVAQEIAGKPIQDPKQWIKDPSMPPVVRTALNAVIEGAFDRR